MEYKLNSKKTFKDQGLLVCLGMIVAYCLMLFPLLRCEWGDDKVEEIKIEEIEKEWEPGDLNEEWNAQEMPVLIEAESHQRFIELCEKYNLPADLIWHTENYYWLKEGTILCLAITETSWGKKWYWVDGCWNYWNVGNTDNPSNRRCFANQWAWLAAIGATLNNDMLKNNKTIACLNGAWECVEANASSYRYATSKSWNWQRNMIWCFYSIYQEKINPQTFNLHDR